MKPMNQVKRIYAPITKSLCIATPYAYVNGKQSYLPLENKAQIEIIEEVQKAGLPVEDDMSLLYGKGGALEHGQIELVLSIYEDGFNTDGEEDADATYAAKVDAMVGVDGDSLGIFPSSTAQHADLKIGGTFGEDTLKVIASLAREGEYLKINGMHIDADDNKHFTAKMVEQQYRHDGSSAGDKNILYPKALASDEQTTIRTINDLDVYLDGYNFLEIPIYKGADANLTLDTTFKK